MDTKIYDQVLALLQERKGEWRRIAATSGVPYSTLCKIAQGHIASPSVHAVQDLYDALTASRAA